MIKNLLKRKETEESLRSLVVELERRILALEKRQVIELEPDAQYLFLVPDTITDSEFEELCKVVPSNVTVISANELKVISLR